MSIYGPELYRLFGRAIDLGILSDYKVLIFDVDQEQVGIDLHSLLSDSGTNINMDKARMVGCWNGLRKRGIRLWDSRNRQGAQLPLAIRLSNRQYPQVLRVAFEAGGEEAKKAHCDPGEAR